ncbi:hypothetical protein COO91_10888 (plasmid) [Nostoc flagelliforme CCNUN1]|uniref:Uncharacterized protein n=1 Tax=Nostoc flagelliforme CCNUN1 TaxID=2038116 RepID=A0A2K8TAF3_9NOSO|nr:hypothetical protein COO91_10888 [Nostoc flagelliforme CCNUN1]
MIAVRQSLKYSNTTLKYLKGTPKNKLSNFTLSKRYFGIAQ